MARYRKIYVSVWGDAKFRRLSSPQPNAQSLWFYLLTNKRTTNIPGLFECGELAMAEELGWDLKGFRKGFRELFQEGMVEADWGARLVWVPNAVRYNPPENPNVVKSWRVWWDEAPECHLKIKAYSVLKEFTEGLGEGFAKGFAKACPEPSRKGLRNQEHEHEQEQEQEEERDGADAPASSPPRFPERGQAIRALALSKRESVELWHRGQPITKPGHIAQLCELAGGPVGQGGIPITRHSQKIAELLAIGDIQPSEYEGTLQHLADKEKQPNVGLFVTVLVDARRQGQQGFDGGIPKAKRVDKNGCELAENGLPIKPLYAYTDAEKALREKVFAESEAKRAAASAKEGTP